MLEPTEKSTETLPKEVIPNKLSTETELAGVTPELLGESTLPEVIKVGDEDVSTQTLIDTYVNKHEWSKAGTERDQFIARQRDELTEKERAIQQRELDLRAMEMGVYQPSVQTQQTSTPEVNLDEFDDPAMKAMYQKMQGLEKSQKEWLENYERQRFIETTQTNHQRLQSQFTDYDPVTIERSVIQGRNQFEDAYKAQKYDKIKSGDEDSVKGLISNDLMKKIRLEERRKIIDEARQIEKKRKALALPQPSKSALLTLPQRPATNYTEVKKNTVEMLTDEGISLIK